MSAVFPAIAHKPKDEDPILTKAEQGDPVAQDRLGYMYYTGENRQRVRDYAAALDWFRKSAAQGNASAEDHLGVLYYNGYGVPRDYAEAAQWYQKAAAQGNVHAERMLAQMYAGGLGVARDSAESKKWSRKVAEQEPKNHRVLGAWLAFLLVVLVLAAFLAGLIVLQREKHPPWTRFGVAPFVHLIGIALVLNTVNTYGFGLFFPKCKYNFLAAGCSQYGANAHFLETLGNWQMVNLIFRFMMIAGFSLDILAGAYLVYLFKRIRSGRRKKPLAGSVIQAPTS